MVGLISAGAFVAFSGAAPAQAELPFEGMLPVRVLAAAPPAGSGRGPRGGRTDAGARRGRRGRRERTGREWWELNEEGTILSGERSGSSIRLGEP